MCCRSSDLSIPPPPPLPPKPYLSPPLSCTCNGTPYNQVKYYWSVAMVVLGFVVSEIGFWSHMSHGRHHLNNRLLCTLVFYRDVSSVWSQLPSPSLPPISLTVVWDLSASTNPQLSSSGQNNVFVYWNYL